MQRKIKIATIGAAVQDVFLLGSVLKAKRDVRSHDFVEQFPLGAKLELDKVVFSTGGGATNAAVTFARFGLSSMYLGKIGDDPAGQHVQSDLKSEGINIRMMACDVSGTTGYSTLLLSPRGERTVLVYRGVSQELRAEDFNNFEDLRADWLYITSLSGNFPILEKIIQHAKAHDIKLAINPGSGELKQPERLRDMLESFSLVSLNKEEASQLVEGETAEELVKNIASLTNIAVVTDGPNGSYASDGEKIYAAGMYEDAPVIDRTGAGDAFTSGFVAKIASGASIPEALTYGSANSTSVVGKIGAKEGIITSDFELKKMPIEEIEIHKEKTHA